MNRNAATWILSKFLLLLKCSVESMTLTVLFYFLSVLMCFHNKRYLCSSTRPRTWMCSTPAPCWRRAMTSCSSGLLVWWWWASNWRASCPSKRCDQAKQLKPKHNTTGCDICVMRTSWSNDDAFLFFLQDDIVKMEGRRRHVCCV